MNESDVKDKYDWPTGSLVFGSDEPITKVGPKGYEHGWHYVGPQAAGARVFHPKHGHGEVVRHHNGKVNVHFDSGHKAEFEARHDRDAARLSNALRGEEAYDHVPRAQLKDAHEQAVRYYAGPGFDTMNSLLRTGSRVADPGRQFRVDTSIKALDEVFKDAPKTTVPIEVDRGVMDPSKLFGRVGSKIGKTFSDKGYVSTTTERSVAEFFAEGNAGSRTAGSNGVITIKIPPGTRVLKVDYRGESQASSEKELLLNRGSSFKVVQDEIGDHGLRHTVLELR